MLENTLGGSKERVEETGVATFVFGDTFLYWGGGDVAICCLSCSCEDTRSGAGDMSHASMSSCTWDAQITLERSFVHFHLTLSRAQLRTHAQTYHLCVRSYPLFFVCSSQTFKGLSMPLWANKANLSRCGEVMFPQQPVNKLACGWSSAAWFTLLHTLYRHAQSQTTLSVL